MRILTRHILLELAKVFLVSLSVVTGMVLIEEGVRTAWAHGLPAAQLLRLFPYILPTALRVAVPVTLLLATTTVYARMAGSNEVVAIKSLGIFPMAVLWPAMVAAFLLSLATVWLNDVAVSWGRNGVERVLVEAVEQIAYGSLRTQHRYSAPNFTILVERVEGRRLIRPTLTVKARGNTPAIIFTAEEAKLQSDLQENVLKIILQNGTIETVEVEGRVTLQFPGELTHKMPLWKADQEDVASGRPSWLPLRVIPDEILSQRAEIERYEQELAVRAAYQMLCGDFDGLTSREWDTRRRQLDKKHTRLHRLRTEPYRRWSEGFGCLCFVFVGAPMAIRLRNRDFLTSFFLCFAPILIVYYPALFCTVDAAKYGRVHPLVVWAGNLILFCWGGYLLRKVIRY